MLFTGESTVCFLDLLNSGILFNSKELMWDKSLEWFDVPDLFETEKAHVVSGGKDQELADKRFVEPFVSINCSTLLKTIFADLALTVLGIVIDSYISVEDGLNDCIVRGGYQSYGEERQPEVIESRIIVVQ